MAEWEPAFRRANRKLEVTGEKGLRGYATTGTLAQVIATLLDNALVHGSGTVTIRTSQTLKSVVIEVRDEGRGVPEDLVPRIFERNVSSRPQGTGLGLALAREHGRGGRRAGRAGPAEAGRLRRLPAAGRARRGRGRAGGQRPGVTAGGHQGPGVTFPAPARASGSGPGPS